MNTTENKGVQDALNMAHGFEKTLEIFFTQFPHIPEGGRKVIADILPWVALVFGMLGIIGALLGGVLSAFATLFASVYALLGFLTVIISLAVAVLEILAFQPLKEKMKKGWNYLYYGLLLSALSTIISVAGSLTSLGGTLYMGGVMAGLIGGVLGFIIGGWILFEVRSYFTK